MNSPCPGDELWLRLLDGTLEGAHAEPLARHLETCPACLLKLEQLAGGRTTSFAFAAAGETPAPTSAALDQVMILLKHGVVSAGVPEPPDVQALLQPARRSDALGTFGNYDILEIVAAGGMGIVLKAFDPSLERLVAIKLLPPALAASPEARERFLREARAAAAVHHDNIIVIHAVGEENGLPFIVMQFIGGGTLQQWLEQRGALSFSEALQVGRQVAAGLAAAHAAGLVHRDIKPGNILLEDGLVRVRITDFGLVHSVRQPIGREGRWLAGTPQFMSPEQAAGDNVDARSDLFSLGVVLYALATGAPPRQPAPLGEMMRQLREDPIPDLPEAVGYPEAFRRLVHRLTQRDTAARPDSAARVIAELEGMFPQNSHRSGPRTWVVAAVAGLVLLIAFNRWHDPSPGPPVADRHLHTLERTGAEYPGLAEAILAARAGDVIEVAGDGPQLTEPLVIERPLHIRAASDTRPELICDSTDAPLLTATADVTLEGLVLRHRLPVVDAPPLIRISNASLRLMHCRLVKRSMVTRTEAARVFHIEAVDAPRIEVLNSEIVPHEQGVGGVRAEFSAGFPNDTAAGGVVYFDNSLVGGMQCLRVDNHSQEAVRIFFQRSILLTRGLIRLDETDPENETDSGNKIDVTAEGSVIDVGSLLFGMTRDADYFTRNVRWSGRDNRYSLQFGYVTSPDSLRARFRSPHPQTFGEWTRQPGVTETNSRSVRLDLRTQQAGALARVEEITAARLPLPTDLDQALGPDPLQMGPGEPYWRWREQGRGMELPLELRQGR